MTETVYLRRGVISAMIRGSQMRFFIAGAAGWIKGMESCLQALNGCNGDDGTMSGTILCVLSHTSDDRNRLQVLNSYMCDNRMTSDLNLYDHSWIISNTKCLQVSRRHNVLRFFTQLKL